MNLQTIEDQRCLAAAEGWLELGDWREANAELENISPQSRAHPEVLRLRWEIYSNGRKWESALEIAQAISAAEPHTSYGVIRMGIALDAMERTKEAWKLMLSVVGKFPNEHWMRYNLACYACKLGHLEEAVTWLKRCFDICDDLRARSLTNPNLEPVWTSIPKI